MQTKSFLIPVGAAVAALLPAHTQAKPVIHQVPDESQPRSSAIHESTEASAKMVKELLYPLGSDLHSLILRQADTSVIFAGHGSHQSHYSHGSHRSHRSGY